MNALDEPHEIAAHRGRNHCDCDPSAHHRWNCSRTPIWAQTMRDLDINPWLHAQFIAIYAKSISVGLHYV